MPGLVASLLISSACLFSSPDSNNIDAEAAAVHITVPGAGDVSTSMRTDRKDLYNQGISFDDFLENAEKRRERWVRNYANGDVDEDLLERALAVNGTWRLLTVAVDSCSDSVSTIPYLAHLVKLVPNLDMRIIDSTAGREVMLDHLTADGRSATPTIVLLNESYEEVGCFVERPVLLQEWATENKEKLEQGEYLKQKFAWYDGDAGRQTIEAIVELMEAAAEGKTGC